MSTEKKWMELCELASKETDSEKLLALIQEINRLLAEKDGSMNHAAPNVPPPNTEPA